MTALARAPPAEVPTRRMSFSAFALRRPRQRWPADAVALAQHLGGQLHQRVDLDRRWRVRGCGPWRRELQRAHAARARVAEPLDGVEALGRAALGRQPGVDQRVAEPVGQRIGQQPGQAVKGPARQARETCRRGRSSGIAMGETSMPLRGERRVVLEASRARPASAIDTAPMVRPHSPHLCPGHDWSPQVHSLAARRPVGPAVNARFLDRPCSFTMASGLGTGSGTSASRPLEQIEGPAHADEPRQLRGDLARLQPLHRALRDAGLLRQLGLGEVAAEPSGGQPLPEFPKDGLVCELIRDFHNEP